MPVKEKGKVKILSRKTEDTGNLHGNSVFKILCRFRTMEFLTLGQADIFNSGFDDL